MGVIVWSPNVRESIAFKLHGNTLTLSDLRPERRVLVQVVSLPRYVRTTPKNPVRINHKIVCGAHSSDWGMLLVVSGH